MRRLPLRGGRTCVELRSIVYVRRGDGVSGGFRYLERERVAHSEPTPGTHLPPAAYPNPHGPEPFLLAACKTLAHQLLGRSVLWPECWYSKSSNSCIQQTFYHIATPQQEKTADRET